MAGKTGIEWSEYSWNPLRGCSRVSEGCRHCYAEGQAARIIRMDRGRGVPEGEGAYDGLLAKGGQWNGQIKVVDSLLDQPLRWAKPRFIFVNSMSDLFHENVPEGVIDQIFAVMALATQHTFQVLTKRPERMLAYLSAPHRAEAIGHAESLIYRSIGRLPKGAFKGPAYRHEAWPLPNVWIGVSVENQATANERIPLLLETPAAVRWVSMEPLLGHVDLTRIERRDRNPPHNTWHESALHGCVTPFADGQSLGDLAGASARLDWVVVGGESGPQARPMHPDWARSLRDQCEEAGVPYLFKQWGEWHTSAHVTSTGEPVFRQFESFQHWVNKAQTWVNGGICLDRHGQQLNNGGDFMRARDDGSFPVTIMHRVGKKTAGRHLDGALHDGYPESAPDVSASGTEG